MPSAQCAGGGCKTQIEVIPMNIVLNIVFVILVPIFLGVLLGFTVENTALNMIIVLTSYSLLLFIVFRHIDKKR